MSLLKSKQMCLVLAAMAFTVAPAAAAPVDEPREKPEQDKAWADLAGADNLQALRSLVTLFRAPRHSVPFVAGRLKAMSERPARIGELIEDLDSWTPAVRDKAIKELETVTDEAAPDLQKYLNANPAPEVRQRVEQMLARRRTADVLGARRTRILPRGGAARSGRHRTGPPGAGVAGPREPGEVADRGSRSRFEAEGRAVAHGGLG